MRAILVNEFGPLENAGPGEVVDPIAGPGELLVEVHATAANFVDILLIGGMHQSKPKLPYIPGKGPAGVVRAAGEGVTGFAPGDRVLAMCEPGGGYAELLAIPATMCHRMPDSLPFADAAAMALIYDTAWFSLCERGRFQPGESVLVLGATGGVGLAAIQLVKALGGKALAAVADPAKADLVTEAGADAVIDIGREDVRDSLREQVHADTDGAGADIVIDALGDRFFEAAIRAVAWCGRYVVIGFAAGAIPTLKVNYLLVRNIEVSGLQIGDYRKRRPDRTAACFDQIFALYEQGKIGPPPYTTMPIERATDALRAIRDRKARGRIVLLQDR
jgi:NADPH2:quinone reductase